MSFLWVLSIISLVLAAVGIYVANVLSKKEREELVGVWFFTMCIVFICSICFIVISIASIIHPIELKKEALRMEKERQQIVYQIDNMNSNSDKVKINEWILKYNSWVNDVNSSKEMYGFWSWYCNFDMRDHTIILLQ